MTDQTVKIQLVPEVQSDDLAPKAFDFLVEVVEGEQAYRNQLLADLTSANEQIATLTEALENCEDVDPPDPPDPPTGEVWRFGYYQQGPSTSKPVESVYGPQEDRWGVDFDCILTFTPDESWDTIAGQSWWTTTFGSARSRWAADYGTVVLLPLCPRSVPNISSIAPDDIWEWFTKAGERMVAAGMARSIIRPGWESQGTWYNWSSVDNPGTYKARFRDAVNAMKSVPGQEFLFDWNIAGGKTVDLAAFDPEVVDIVSIDLYDNTRDWSKEKTWLDESWKIASDHGKGWAIAEWGLWGANNPAFINNMAAYLDSHPHVHQQYFDVNSSAEHRLSVYPPSEDAFGAWAPNAVHAGLDPDAVVLSAGRPRLHPRTRRENW